MPTYKPQHDLNLAAGHFCSTCAKQEATEGKYAYELPESNLVLVCIQNTPQFRQFFFRDALNCWHGEVMLPPHNFLNPLLSSVSRFLVALHCNQLMQPWPGRMLGSYRLSPLLLNACPPAGL